MDDSASGTQLPQELIDSILDNVYKQQDLRACALVARSFRLPSQRKLFEHLSLHPEALHGEPASIAHFERLHAIFIESPHLAKFVKSLDLRVLRAENLPLMETEVVLDILGALCNVVGLDIHAPTVKAPRLAAALVPMIGSAGLKTLSLRNDTDIQLLKAREGDLQTLRT
ncbi:hypothetical protein MIND_00649000 [Mycena indigotica]|uniref:F-box domain-containing protein n=1 Tax=Mycena indigotica TaxID=2126181 RepID=A0A8H6SSC0_9AGAR|nr:uncharacterized protein MIND_00649000 [Mycena indigotica]KAF7304170.1 hypothetical protein MIND_00649000 [Mycena indigotica]